MESIVYWFTENFGGVISREALVFIISLLPILECRGGLLAASLLKVPLTTAIPICVAGNIIPIPFLLLFIKKILILMEKFKVTRPFACWLRERAEKRSGKVEASEFWGLTLFVGIPLPGTGAWTGSLIAALLEMDIKKAVICELVGVALATIIMSIVSYGLLGTILS
ncbi:MAG: small multi-drug export protein [Lachnospiraceae bacterium]|nr:small multi-drug export protein [Lachnospiraceae bacterium]